MQVSAVANAHRRDRWQGCVPVGNADKLSCIALRVAHTLDRPERRARMGKYAPGVCAASSLGRGVSWVVGRRGLASGRLGCGGFGPAPPVVLPGSNTVAQEIKACSALLALEGTIRGIEHRGARGDATVVPRGGAQCVGLRLGRVRPNPPSLGAGGSWPCPAQASCSLRRRSARRDMLSALCPRGRRRGHAGLGACRSFAFDRDVGRGPRRPCWRRTVRARRCLRAWARLAFT